MLTFITLELPGLSHFHVTSFYYQRFRLHQSLSNLPAGRFDDPAEGLARDIHLLRGLILVKPLEVREAYGFKLIHGQRKLLKLGHRNALRLEASVAWEAPHSSAIRSSSHLISGLRGYYKHMPIILSRRIFVMQYMLATQVILTQ